MRRGPLKASVPQELCIFCATRLQNASTRASHRRLFASTAAAQKPPAEVEVAPKKQNGNDQGWAAWTPPKHVFQPQNALETQRDSFNHHGAASKGLPRTRSTGPERDQQSGVENGFLPSSSESTFRIRRERQGSRVLQEHQPTHELEPRPHLRKSSPVPTRDRYSFSPKTKEDSNAPNRSDTEADAAVWQGLRRHTPVGAREVSSKDSVREQRHTQKSQKNEEQMRRLEASKQGYFVGLEGLHRRRIRSFEDANLPRANESRRHDAETSSSARQRDRGSPLSLHSTASTETHRPLTRKINDVTPASRPAGGWTRYEPNSSQRTHAETGASRPATRHAATTRSERPSRAERSLVRKNNIYNEWADATTYSQDTSSTPVETLSTDRQDSGILQQNDRQKKSSTNRTFGASEVSERRPRPGRERETEIVAARDRGRSASSISSYVPSERRKARRRVPVSRDVDEDAGLDEDEFSARRAARQQKMKKAKERQKQNGPATPIFLPEFISVSNLARALRVRVEDFLSKMQQLGFDGLTNDHVLDAETAGLVASEYNFEPIIDRSEELDLKAQPIPKDKSALPARPPVVTIMGHVDHGKTTLLDFLRKSSVAASEHGGITQHIGAFSVPMSGGRLVTFLDTPGHAAFLNMRQRGANVTDIVILVVAADDSVKPQTIEAIKHAQSANVPIIVAINKIDKEDAAPDRVKQDLARYGVEIEDFGGDTQVVCVSGKTGQGMVELEDAAVALADILDMRAATDGLAEGWVLEATTKKAGRVATVLVRRGTLHPGDIIVAGTSWARVRSLRNEAGVMIDAAGPGTPVEIDGWREQPTAGDEVLQSPNNDEQKAKSVIEHRLEASQRLQLAKDMDAVNEARRIEQEKREQLERAKELAEANANGVATSADAEAAAAASEQKEGTGPKMQEVFFILKADVSGSVEAVANAITALGSAEIRAHILRTGVGPITEFDIDHAAVASGHIINFNTPVPGEMRRLAEDKSVQIFDQSIIYRLIDQIKGVLQEKLPSLTTKRVLGEADVSQVFEINVKGRQMMPVAGCKVRNGEVNRRGKVRVMRGGEVIFDGTLSSLKNVKKDITEARKGMECGLGFEGWTDFKVGDQVQSYEEKIEQRTL